MTEPHVGFYVHYHGQGHKHRTEAILRHLTLPASVVTSRLEEQDWNGPTLTEVFGIACDNDGVNRQGLAYADQVAALHYAPLWTDTITNRVAAYTAWLDRHKPDVMIVDVSVEISVLTRLASIPQIVMRQHGKRDDPAHLGAYQAAHSLLAPFPQMMEDDITPDWVAEKTVYLDGFCPGYLDDFRQGDHEQPATGQLPRFPKRRRIAVLFGRGGRSVSDKCLFGAAKSTPDFDWTVIGPDDRLATPPPSNMTITGWVDNPRTLLQTADLVVTAAGHNSVMEVGCLRKPMIAVAQDRPFDEQVRKVEVLNRQGLAVGLQRWPAANLWPEIIRRADRLNPDRWDEVFRTDGSKRAGEHITEVANWSHQQRQQPELKRL